MSQLKNRIQAILSLDPAAPAMEFEESWASWGDLGAAVDAIDSILQANGLGADARIGVMLRNHVAVVPAVLAVIGARCVVTLSLRRPWLSIRKSAGMPPLPPTPRRNGSPMRSPLRL